MTDALAQFGFVEFVGGLVRNLGLGATALPYLTASIVAVTTNFISGTAAAALFASVFVPAAVEVGYNPTSIAILIANVALGLVFPWAGAASATAFGAGAVSLRQMIRVGVVATVLFTLVVATIHLLLSGFL